MKRILTYFLLFFPFVVLTRTGPREMSRMVSAIHTEIFKDQCDTDCCHATKRLKYLHSVQGIIENEGKSLEELKRKYRRISLKSSILKRFGSIRDSYTKALVDLKTKPSSAIAISEILPALEDMLLMDTLSDKAKEQNQHFVFESLISSSSPLTLLEKHFDCAGGRLTLFCKMITQASPEKKRAFTASIQRLVQDYKDQNPSSRNTRNSFKEYQKRLTKGFPRSLNNRSKRSRLMEAIMDGQRGNILSSIPNNIHRFNNPPYEGSEQCLEVINISNPRNTRRHQRLREQYCGREDSDENPKKQLREITTKADAIKALPMYTRYDQYKNNILEEMRSFSCFRDSRIFAADNRDCGGSLALPDTASIESIRQDINNPLFQIESFGSSRKRGNFFSRIFGRRNNRRDALEFIDIENLQSIDRAIEAKAMDTLSEALSHNLDRVRHLPSTNSTEPNSGAGRLPSAPPSSINLDRVRRLPSTNSTEPNSGAGRLPSAPPSSINLDRVRRLPSTNSTEPNSGAGRLPSAPPSSINLDRVRRLPSTNSTEPNSGAGRLPSAPPSSINLDRVRRLPSTNSTEPNSGAGRLPSAPPSSINLDRVRRLPSTNSTEPNSGAGRLPSAPPSSINLDDVRFDENIQVVAPVVRPEVLIPLPPKPVNSNRVRRLPSTNSTEPNSGAGRLPSAPPSSINLDRVRRLPSTNSTEPNSGAGRLPSAPPSSINLDRVRRRLPSPPPVSQSSTEQDSEALTLSASNPAPARVALIVPRGVAAEALLSPPPISQSSTEQDSEALTLSASNPAPARVALIVPRGVAAEALLSPPPVSQSSTEQDSEALTLSASNPAPARVALIVPRGVAAEALLSPPPISQQRSPAEASSLPSPPPVPEQQGSLALDNSSLDTLRNMFKDNNCPNRPKSENKPKEWCESCAVAVREWYENNSIWKGTTREERAKRIVNLIGEKIAQLKTDPTTQVHSDLKEGLIACIVKTEVAGSAKGRVGTAGEGFYPETVNYTFCEGNNRWNNGRPRSAALGLGQMTLGLFRGLQKNDIMTFHETGPITKGPRSVVLHESLPTRPDLQIEATVRYMNHLLFGNEPLKPCAGRPGLTQQWEKAVVTYDQGSCSKYIDNVRACKSSYEEATTLDDKAKLLAP